MSRRRKRSQQQQGDQQQNADAADEKDIETGEDAGEDADEEGGADESMEDAAEEAVDASDDESGDDAEGNDETKPPTVDPESGPTVAEWVLAGYSPSKYPPSPYVSKSTEEEIASLVALETAGASKEEVEAAARAQMSPQGVAVAGDGEVADEVVAAEPAHGTAEAADVHIADLPDHPDGSGAKILDRPFLKTGASG